MFIQRDDRVGHEPHSFAAEFYLFICALNFYPASW